MSAITLKCQIEPDSGEKRTQTCAPPSPATKCVCVCVGGGGAVANTATNNGSCFKTNELIRHHHTLQP